jgi:predicted nucleotidyltransferase
MEILGKILGSPARVKIMRLFLLNQGESFATKDIKKRSRVTQDVLHKELKMLNSVGFIKKHSKDYIFNPTFKYGTEIEELLVNSDTIDSEVILETFKKAGKVKLVIVSGIFIKNKDSRVDILIVGDKLKRSKIDEGIHKLEAEIGVELVYAVFDVKEFSYRLNMYDKLIRDIIDFPHEIIYQAKELSTQSLKKV